MRRPAARLVLPQPHFDLPLNETLKLCSAFDLSQADQFSASRASGDGDKCIDNAVNVLAILTKKDRRCRKTGLIFVYYGRDKTVLLTDVASEHSRHSRQAIQVVSESQ